MTEISNTDLRQTCEWFKANKLATNLFESNIIIIPSKQNKPPATFETYLNSALIPQTSTTNYLEMTINTDMIFYNHIIIIKTQNIEDNRILSKLRHFLSQSALLKICYVLIHSQLMYGLVSGALVYFSLLH